MTMNQMFKNVVASFGKHGKDEFIRNFGVDVQNVQPIDATNLTYNRKEHKNCFFLFLDADLKIIGVVEGATPLKKLNEHVNYIYNKLPKNWKHMKPKAAYILMFTPKMRTYRPKPQPTRKNRNDDYNNLMKRLKEYKVKKYEFLNDDNVIKMAKEVIALLSVKLFENDPTFINEIRKVDWSDNSASKALRTFAGIIEDFQKYQIQTAEDEKAGYHNDYYKTQLNDRKLQILKWHNVMIA